MSPLKSAHELALERIISTRYVKEEEPSAIPEFVTDFEYPGGKDKNSDGEEYGDAFVESDKNNSKKDINLEKNVKIQEPESIHFNDKLIEVCWNGHFFDYGGFSRMNRTMAFGLSNRNVRVKVEIEPYLDHINDATKDQLRLMSNIQISPGSPKVFGGTVPLNLSHDGKKIVYTMIETSNRVHKDYAGKLNLIDEIWTPTQYGKDILKKSNVYPPIYVMPLGVDPSRYRPDAGFMDFGSSMRKFKFLSVFRWSYRKGYDILLRAYLEEFSANDDVSLLLISRAVECPESIGAQKILEDFNNIKDSINKPEEELPHIALYGKTIPEKNVPRIYSSANAFVLISRGEGFCTLPTASIKTPFGVKSIENIKIGDIVFSHRGIMRNVTHVFKRQYSGEMVRIKCCGRNNQCLNLTPNHNIKALRINDVSTNTRLKLLKKVSYDINNDKLNISSNKHFNNKYDKFQLEWINAGNIKKGDYLFYPKLQYKTNMDKWMVNDMLFLNKIDVFKKTFIIEDNSLFKGVRNQFGGPFKGQCLFNKTKLPLTNNFLKLMGYFVAEGCCNKNEVMFSFNKNETKYHKEVIKLMKEIFGKITFRINYFKDKKCVNIIFQSIVASRLLRFLFGHRARNKTLPLFMFSLVEQQKYHFLHGLFNGDGSYSKIEKTSLSTASLGLANNIFDILFSIGIKSSIKSRVLDGKIYYAIQITNSRDCNKFLTNIDEKQYLKSNRRHSEKYKSYNNFQLLIVSDVKKEHYEGEVYNIGVEGDNSYICENIAVHNCLPMVEAGASELPVIASNCSGQTDFLNDGNSYLVEPDDYVKAEVNGNLSRMAKLCHFYEGQEFPEFRRPAIDKTKEHMRFVFENYGAAKEKAKKLRSFIINNYTWDMAIDRVYKRLKEINEKN